MYNDLGHFTNELDKAAKLRKDVELYSLCRHDSLSFDRSVCPDPCNSMHYYCDDCGEVLDVCEFSIE
jgi:hypothetical protein